jgi:RND family efflux transporter MFP subunit
MRRILIVSLLTLSVAGCGSSGNNNSSSAGGAAAGMGGSSGGPGGPGGMSANTTAMSVEVVQAKLANSTQVLETSGGLYAWQEVAVGAEVSGYRVAEVLVDVGDIVSQGQVLARLDNTLLKQAYDQAQAAVAVAKATMNQAQASARRGNSLQESGLISKQDSEQLNTNAATAGAQLQSAESQLQSAKQRLDYADIKATDPGVISARNVAPGQIANAGSSLFTLIRDSRVEWRADIPAAYIGRVKRGMRASIKRLDGSSASGTVRTVSPGLDANSQRGTAYVDLRLEAQIRPGMFVSGSIDMDKAKVLTVPISAVTVRDGFSYVFVVQADGAVRQQRVTVSRLLSDTVELSDGVSADDQIASSGVGLLRDGDKVSISNNSNSGATAEQPAGAKAKT